MPRQLAWCKRPAEDGKMIVRLDLWARLRRKSHVGGTSTQKKQFPASILVALTRDILRCLHAKSGSTPDSGAMKIGLLLAVRKHVTREDALQMFLGNSAAW